MSLRVARLGLLAVLLVSACTRPSTVDGRWSVISVDSVPTDRTQWWIDVENSVIVGGRDGCNKWRYRDSNSPITLSDGQECAPDSIHSSYWRVVTANRDLRNGLREPFVLRSEQASVTLRKAS